MGKKNINHISYKKAITHANTNNKLKKSKSKNYYFIETKLTLDNFLKKLKEENYKDKTIKSIKSIYMSYKKFFFYDKNKTYIKLNKLKSNNGSLMPKDFFLKNSIDSFINSLYYNKPGTRKKKRYILLKALFNLKTGIIKKRNTPQKDEDKKIIQGIYEEEISLFFDFIYNTNNIDLILIYHLSFELGLTLSQLIRLKYIHIKNDFEYISLKINNTKIYRRLNIYSSCLMKYYSLSISHQKKDYIIFPGIINSKSIRLNECKKKFFCLNKKYKINRMKNYKKILSIMNKIHNRIKIGSFKTMNKQIFFNKIWKKLGLFLNLTNNHDNHSLIIKPYKINNNIEDSNENYIKEISEIKNGIFERKNSNNEFLENYNLINKNKEKNDIDNIFEIFESQNDSFDILEKKIETNSIVSETNLFGKSIIKSDLINIY